MIVQSPARDGSRFVLTMEQHTQTGAIMARHFDGASGFERLEPHEMFVEFVAEHDRGWMPIDDEAPGDPHTGLP